MNRVATILLAMLIIFISDKTFASKGLDLPYLWPWNGIAMSSIGTGPEDIDLVYRELGVNCIALQLMTRLRALRFRLGKEDAWKQELIWADKMLDACENLGITAIIVIYQFPIDPNLGFDEKSAKFWDDSAQTDEVIRLSGELSKHFKDRGRELGGYQILSEPVVFRLGLPTRPETWPNLLKKIIETIRTYDYERWVAITPGPGGQPSGYKNFNPLPYKHIIYNAHMYTPHTFTHQGVLNYPLGPTYPGIINLKYWDKFGLINELNPVRTFQEKFDVPIWIGEFSSARWAQGAEQYVIDVSDVFKDYGWGWSYFAYNGSPVWNPNYNSEYAAVTDRNVWENQYVGLESKRWGTLRMIFGKSINKPRIIQIKDSSPGGQ